MIIERELEKTLLQPQKGKRLYFVHYSHNRAFFDLENSVISFSIEIILNTRVKKKTIFWLYIKI